MCKTTMWKVQSMKNVKKVEIIKGTQHVMDRKTQDLKGVYLPLTLARTHRSSAITIKVPVVFCF